MLHVFSSSTWCVLLCFLLFCHRRCRCPTGLFSGSLSCFLLSLQLASVNRTRGETPAMFQLTRCKMWIIFRALNHRWVQKPHQKEFSWFSFSVKCENDGILIWDGWFRVLCLLINTRWTLSVFTGLVYVNLNATVYNHILATVWGRCFPVSTWKDFHVFNSLHGSISSLWIWPNTNLYEAWDPLVSESRIKTKACVFNQRLCNNGQEKLDWLSQYHLLNLPKSVSFFKLFVRFYIGF